MEPETLVCIHVALALFPIYAIVIRFMMISPSLRKGKQKGGSKKITDIVDAKLKNIMIFLGSGGHTGEMLRILDNLDLSAVNRSWIVSSGDNSSLKKAESYESTNVKKGSASKARFLSVPRARSVGEPKFLAIKSTLKSFLNTTVALYYEHKPDVVLLNGPGTSVPIAYILFAFKFFGLCSTKIIYIESLARVHLLSLTGRLVTPTADRIIVQWPQIRDSCHRTEYYGILV